MLAYEQAKVPLPDGVALVIQRGKKVMIRFIPHHINALAIHRRSGRGIAIELVPREGHESEITFPFHFPVIHAQTKHRQAAGSVAGAGDKDSPTPKNWRGITAARQLNLPIDIGIGDFSGDVFGVTDASAIWATKTSPFLGGEVEDKDHQRGDYDGRQRDTSPSLDPYGLW